MALADRISDETKTALKASASSEEAKFKVATLRLMTSEMKYKAKELKKEVLEDEEIFDIINSMVKKRTESAKMYRQGEREELAEKEEREIAVLRQFLPAQLDEAEIEELVDKQIAAAGASSMKDMGKVMGPLAKEYKGRVEPAKLSAVIKAKLSGN